MLIALDKCSEMSVALTWPSRRTHSGRVLSAHQPSLGWEGYHPGLLRPLQRRGALVPDGAAESPAAAAPASAPPGSAGGPAPEPARSRWMI